MKEKEEESDSALFIKFLDVARGKKILSALNWFQIKNMPEYFYIYIL